MIKTILALPKIARNRIFKATEPIGDFSSRKDRAPAVLFVLTIFFYIAYQLAMQPGWVLGGEMWAEMATNYFPNANSPSYLQKLFATDAGYIPAPQRIIALIGNVFNLPAASIPYLYTWSAIMLTGMMIGAFCLAPFRALVKNDALRFLTAFSILVVADFETRAFINFTYFAAFFVAIVTALAMADDSKEVPWWAWFIPILMVSKPAVLAALPAMIFVAMVRKSRFRWITIVTVALCIAQIAQMAVSREAGVLAQANEIGFFTKVITAFKYFFGFLGGYISGPGLGLGKYVSMLAGFIVLSASGFVIFKRKSPAGAVILAGFSLLFFNVLLFSFALSDEWGSDMAQLAFSPLDRHKILVFFGCVLVVAGLIASLTDEAYSKYKLPRINNFGALLFIGWFAGSGWFLLGGKISREPGSPFIQNSQWQNLARAIDIGVSPLCVPIDPLGWTYSRNCSFLNLRMPPRIEGVQQIDDSGTFEVAPPAVLSEKTLVSLAVLARPITTQTTFLAVKASIHLTDGSVKIYSGGRDLNMSGGLILLTGNDRIQIKNVSLIRFEFNSPVKIATFTTEQNSTSAVLWMGQ